MNFKSFIHKFKLPLLLFVTGVLLHLIANLIRTDFQVIQGHITILRLIGLVLISSSVMIYGAKSKRYLIANIGSIIGLIFLFELTCFLLMGMPEKIINKFEVPQNEQESLLSSLGHGPIADSVYHDVKVLGQDTVFDVHYSIDSLSGRFTPGYDSTRSEFSMFFGCSIAFGYGLNDNETFPYFFQQVSNSNAYNLSFQGYGTNHMLARLQYSDLKPYVKEKKGKAYYIFFWDHIDRAIGTMARHTQWLHSAPNYEYEDGKLVRNGSFKSGRPIRSWFYEHLYQSSIIQYFDVSFPLKMQEEHYDLVAEMIKCSKDEFQNQFGENDFYLVIYPNYGQPDEANYKLFLSLLTEKGIDYIDLSKNFTYEGKHTLGGDPHPNANTNKVLSEMLNKEIQTK